MARRRTGQEVQEVEITTTSIGADGVTVGRLDDVVHFVKGALPGERVRARIRKTHRRYVNAEVVEVLEAAPERITPPCPEFGTCGGCSWQHLDYTSQVHWKSSIVHDAMQRIGGVTSVPMLDAVPADTAYNYRNKMEFSFSNAPWLTQAEIDSGETFDRTFALGLHVPGRYDKVRHLQHCYLQSQAANELLAAVHALPTLRSVAAYNHREHVGFLRHLVLRTSVTTGAVLCVLITTTPESTEEHETVKAFLDLHRSLPPGSSLIAATNDTHSPVANGTIVHTLGPGYLEETSHGVTYRISPVSFFQTNTNQMHKLIALGLEGARLSQEDVVWDLYCGTGTLTLPAARVAKHVVGAELAQSSIDDGRANAERNGIRNVDLHCVDLHTRGALELLNTFPTPSAMIIDPPRSGMHPQVVEHIRSVTPSRISYVSCNPASLARDYALLSDLYSLEWVRAVDMFPQTSHVEAVASLVKLYVMS